MKYRVLNKMKHVSSQNTSATRKTALPVSQISNSWRKLTCQKSMMIQDWEGLRMLTSTFSKQLYTNVTGDLHVWFSGKSSFSWLRVLGCQHKERNHLLLIIPAFCSYGAIELYSEWRNEACGVQSIWNGKSRTFDHLEFRRFRFVRIPMQG